ncbi:hypothetical protein BHE74_00018770 [Ensete ventricosum]|nr:hypothetical protein BHE74_00018770 [Ensete ventricosum]RZR82160.1 hypothetical protein BHM03_00008524 [Ensete ventricosum]
MLDSRAPPAADPSRIARPPADHIRPTRRPKKLPPGVRSPASIRSVHRPLIPQRSLKKALLPAPTPSPSNGRIDPSPPPSDGDPTAHDLQLDRPGNHPPPLRFSVFPMA